MQVKVHNSYGYKLGCRCTKCKRSKKYERMVSSWKHELGGLSKVYDNKFLYLWQDNENWIGGIAELDTLLFSVTFPSIKNYGSNLAKAKRALYKHSFN